MVTGKQFYFPMDDRDSLIFLVIVGMRCMWSSTHLATQLSSCRFTWTGIVCSPQRLPDIMCCPYSTVLHDKATWAKDSLVLAGRSFRSHWRLFTLWCQGLDKTKIAVRPGRAALTISMPACQMISTLSVFRSLFLTEHGGASICLDSILLRFKWGEWIYKAATFQHLPAGKGSAS